MGGSDDLMGTIGSAVGMGITIGVAGKALNMLNPGRRVVYRYRKRKKSRRR